MSQFKSYNRQQHYLLPPSIDEWLPENHLARFIIEVIDGLDLTRLISQIFWRRFRSPSSSHDVSVIVLRLCNGYIL